MTYPTNPRHLFEVQCDYSGDAFEYLLGHLPHEVRVHNFAIGLMRAHESVDGREFYLIEAAIPESMVTEFLTRHPLGDMLSHADRDPAPVVVYLGRGSLFDYDALTGN